MMAVVVVAAEFDVEECVVVVVLAALVPLALAVELLWDSIRSSFMARLASSVSVAAVALLVAVVGESVPPVPDAPDGGVVGEVVDVGDLSGIGISRSIDF